MPAAAAKRTKPESASNEPAPQPRAARDDRAAALIEKLRPTFARHGIHDGHPPAQGGLYFIAGEHGDVSVHDDERNSANGAELAASAERNDAVVLECCYELARRGFAFNLFVSPRTLALHISSDA